MRRVGEVLETVVVVAIILVLAHTFLDDFAVIAGWGVHARSWLIWAGLGFDLFFTIEFFTRLYIAISNRQGTNYFFRERGWVDFLASIPLLLLNSLPHALALLAGAGLLSGMGSFLNVLKVIKAVRIARILRLLRVVKLFRGIRNARSAMAQGHVSTITTIAVSILVLWTLAASILETTGLVPGLEAPFTQGQAARAAAIAEAGPGAPGLARQAAAVAATDASILAVRPQGGEVVWSRYSASYYADNFLAGDYGYFAGSGVEVFLDERPLAVNAAREGLVFFIAVMLTTLAFLFIYAPRFALQISDPIHVMKRGMSESDYNLEVHIPRGREKDDVFELASLYNGVYLPLKDKAGSQESVPAPALNIDDLKDLAEGK
jgi:Ion transport protein